MSTQTFYVYTEIFYTYIHNLGISYAYFPMCAYAILGETCKKLMTVTPFALDPQDVENRVQLPLKRATR